MGIPLLWHRSTIFCLGARGSLINSSNVAMICRGWGRGFWPSSRSDFSRRTCFLRTDVLWLKYTNLEPRRSRWVHSSCTSCKSEFVSSHAQERGELLVGHSALAIFHKVPYGLLEVAMPGETGCVPRPQALGIELGNVVDGQELAGMVIAGNVNHVRRVDGVRWNVTRAFCGRVARASGCAECERHGQRRIPFWGEPCVFTPLRHYRDYGEIHKSEVCHNG